MLPHVKVALTLLTICLLTTSAFAANACPTTPEPRPTPYKAFHCGVPGRLSKPGSLLSFTPPTYDYKSCYDSCLADKRCVSFSYNNIENICRTFGASLEQKGYEYNPRDWEYFWNLRGCFFVPTGCSTTGVGKTTPRPTCTPSVNLIQNSGFDYSTPGKCKVWTTPSNAACTFDSTAGTAVLQMSFIDYSSTIVTQPFDPSSINTLVPYTFSYQYQFIPPAGYTGSGVVTYNFETGNGSYSSFGYDEEVIDGKWHMYFDNNTQMKNAGTAATLVFAFQSLLTPDQPVPGSIIKIDNMTLYRTPDPRCTSTV